MSLGKCPGDNQRPKSWLDIECVDRMNQHANVVAEYLAQSLVYLSGITLGPNSISELRGSVNRRVS